MYKQIKHGKRFDIKNVSDVAAFNFAIGLVFSFREWGLSRLRIYICW